MGVFNARKTLAAAVESILNQSYHNFEFIIIDDGSDDGSGDILNQFASTDRRIRLIRQNNSGLTAALNVGLEAANGKYIARQDADDISLPFRLEKQFDFMCRHPRLALTGTDYEIIDDNGQHLATVRNSRRKRLIQRLRRSNQFVHGTLMFRSTLTTGAVRYNSYYEKAQDYDLILRISESHGIRIVPEVLYQWRFSKHGILATNVNFYGQRARYNYRQRMLNKPENHDEPIPESVMPQPSRWALNRALAERYLSAYRCREARLHFKRAIAETGIPFNVMLKCQLGILFTFFPSRMLRFVRER